MLQFKLKRYATRNGKVVEWGNVVGPYFGQSFRETFATETDAIERERQALACEDIGTERLPIALQREETGRVK